MYGLIKFPDNTDTIGPGLVLSEIDRLGFKIEFTEDITELISLAGGEVTDEEDFLSMVEAKDRISGRYERLRHDLDRPFVGPPGPASEKQKSNIEIVKVKALIDMAESLALMSGNIPNL